MLTSCVFCLAAPQRAVHGADDCEEVAAHLAQLVSSTCADADVPDVPERDVLVVIDAG